MSFDKVQAMRNAERHVSQGKIRAAIDEYRQVVDHDPKDIGTLNMLGDLYTKDSNKPQAIACYKKVADHYNKQGFSQKAIAVYKKIAKLDPDSVETSGKLAELYQTKGSVSEARSHFATLADHYLNQGRKTEALAIWKQVYTLDQNDTETLQKAAEVFLEEQQLAEAADAFSELGNRLNRFVRYEYAAETFAKAISIEPGNISALTGFVAAKTKLGQAVEASQKLEEILENDPYNREIMALLADCYLGADDIANAEKRVIRLVEHEPSSYPRLVNLVETYLLKDDPSGAARCLTLATEQLLLHGKGEEAGKWIDAILDIEQEQLGALKLKVRYYSWKRDDKGLSTALQKLDEIAVKKDSLEDERYALSQLVMLLPQDTTYAERLRVINEKHGFTDNLYDEAVLKGQFEDQADLYAEELATGFDFSIDNSQPAIADASLIERNGSIESEALPVDDPGKKLLIAEIETLTGSTEVSPVGVPVVSTGDPAKNDAVSKEVESIRFYIESGYSDLAVSALSDLAQAYGEIPEVVELRKELGQPQIEVLSQGTEVKVVEEPIAPEPKSASASLPSSSSSSKTLDLSEIRFEFGVDEEEASADAGDYDTHYQMAVAYQEMGLMEDAIKEFQDAISQIGEDDKTRRFFQCATLLGHCFMQKGMAKLALKWFNRALETPGLNSDEKKGIWYELGEAHEVDGDPDNAARYFEQVYAEDVDFRDVGTRLQNLMVSA